MRKLYLLFTSLLTVNAYAQCPPNIGFEKGNFDHWECFDGKITGNGFISISPSPPISGKHTIIENIAPQLYDTYGNFPVNCPNGSGYSIRLGNQFTMAEAQAAYYTFTVPPSNGDYSIIYNYAVVFQNPNDHTEFEQPRFQVKVFNVTDNQYIDCGAFQFISAPNLPGFKQSPLSNIVFYKDWAPITLKLPGYVGKTLRLEFTINDCSKGGHFGYAYLDINENCTTPITGNVFCKDVTALTLTAPYGFQEYRWYTEDFSKMIGNTNVLKLSPAPPPNTRFALEIVPFPNQGCLDTLYTTITKSLDPFELKIKDSIKACNILGANLTSSSVSAGSSPGMNFAYYTDPDESNFAPNPKGITQSGTYYVKATNSAGCTETKPVYITINPSPVLSIAAPAPACIPETIDLTQPSIIAGSDKNIQVSYWLDILTTKPIPNPSAIAQSGQYYIKALNDKGCDNTRAVMVSIGAKPVTVVKDLVACDYLLLSSVNPAEGSDVSASVSYWADAATTQALAANHVFNQSTNYFIKVTSQVGCAVVKPAKITINPLPQFKVTPPAPVRLPVTINLTNTVPYSNAWQYSYWTDSATTIPLANPTEIIRSGTYYIKAITPVGCTLTQSVPVTINDAIIVPPNAFTPNGDGINDTWEIPLLSFYPETVVELFNRSGQSVFKTNGYTKYWDGKLTNGQLLPMGTYYYVIRVSPKHAPVSGSVSIVY